MDRRGDWIQTYTGKVFWPVDPRPEEVDIEDIAHALSMLCRFGGHCLRFYSVAEHCVHVSTVVPTLAALLHDATEAYVVDVPRPLKRSLTGYAGIEHAVWLAVASRFGLPAEIPAEVKYADSAVLMAEKAQIMAPQPMDWGDAQGGNLIPADVVVQGWSSELAEHRFLLRYHELLGGK